MVQLTDLDGGNERCLHLLNCCCDSFGNIHILCLDVLSCTQRQYGGSDQSRSHSEKEESKLEVKTVSDLEAM